MGLCAVTYKGSDVCRPALRYVGIDYTDREVVAYGDAVIVRGTARMKLQREPGGRQEYAVLFLDADDWLVPAALETLAWCTETTYARMTTASTVGEFVTGELAGVGVVRRR